MTSEQHPTGVFCEYRSGGLRIYGRVFTFPRPENVALAAIGAVTKCAGRLVPEAETAHPFRRSDVNREFRLDSSSQKDADLIDLKKRAAEMRRKNQPKPDPREEGARNRIQVVGLVITLGLIVAGWLLVQVLGRNAKMEDCLMSGRSNCAPIDVPTQTR